MEVVDTILLIVINLIIVGGLLYGIDGLSKFYSSYSNKAKDWRFWMMSIAGPIAILSIIFYYLYFMKMPFEN